MTPFTMMSAPSGTAYASYLSRMGVVAEDLHLHLHCFGRFIACHPPTLVTGIMMVMMTAFTGRVCPADCDIELSVGRV
jgi:hypothetical protein